MYEEFIHKINMACTCMDNLAIQEYTPQAE